MARRGHPGSGGVAVLAARAGATVTGIDVAPEAIEQARRQGGAEFLVADAQALPFADASFDVVVSAFGANFAPDHAVAAAELGRVCREGGRLGMALMPTESRAAELWSLIRRYDGHGDHPAEWSERVDELLGPWFELESQPIESPADEEPEPATAWDYFRESFGPLRSLLARLDEMETAAVREEFLAIRHRYDGRPKSYVLVLGRRR